jgi:hypothetical protein
LAPTWRDPDPRPRRPRDLCARRSLREVRIDRLVDQAFYAVIVLDGLTGQAEVDARPSDAVTVALVTGAPIRVDGGVVEAVEASGFVSSSLAAMGSQDEAGPQEALSADLRRPPICAA